MQNTTNLLNLIQHENPQAVLTEIKIILSSLYKDFDFKNLFRIFYDVVRLFNGEFPGYKKSKTEYHDLKHTTDTFLAMSRLLHGYSIKNPGAFSEDEVLGGGLVGSLMFDSGYMLLSDDDINGEIYSFNQIEKSISFIEKYFDSIGIKRDFFVFCKNIILFPGKKSSDDELNLSSKKEEILAKMLFTAEQLGQMSDRIYLEKLLFLYYELHNANISIYKSELDLLKKTLKLYGSTIEKLSKEYDSLYKFMVEHFRVRWNIPNDLYMEAIDKNIKYLKFVLENHESSYRDYLRRGNIIDKISLLSG